MAAEALAQAAVNGFADEFLRKEAFNPEDNLGLPQ
jgi:hypothetical protein